MTALFSEHTVQISPRGVGMDAIVTELAANRLMYDHRNASRMKRSGHRIWRSTCEGFQDRDQCLRLLRFFCISSSGGKRILFLRAR